MGILGPLFSLLQFHWVILQIGSLTEKQTKSQLKSIIIVYINLNADALFLLIFSTEISIQVFAHTSISSLRALSSSPWYLLYLPQEGSLFSASALNLDQSKSSIIVSWHYFNYFSMSLPSPRSKTPSSKACFTKHLSHEMPLHKNSSTVKTFQATLHILPPTWRFMVHISILKALRSPAVSRGEGGVILKQCFSNLFAQRIFFSYKINYHSIFTNTPPSSLGYGPNCILLLSPVAGLPLRGTWRVYVIWTYWKEENQVDNTRSLPLSG